MHAPPLRHAFGLRALAGFAWSVLLCVANAHAQTTFIDYTSAAGFTFVGESWGASWGDFNGDGLPDLFVNHHRLKNAVYENLGDGSFEDVTARVDASGIWADGYGDSHGGTWADFDNDGDQDLFVAYGAADPAEFMVNEDGKLFDRSQQYVPQIPSLRSRLPVWLDFSGDGLLDVIMTTATKAYAFQQTSTTFANVTTASGLSCDASQEVYYADVTGDHQLDVLCASGQFPAKVYDLSAGLPFRNVSSALPVVPTSQGVAAADFNGDLVTDFFVTRGNNRLSGADQVGPRTVAAQLIVQGAGEKSAGFVSAGDLAVTISIEGQFTNANVWLGSTGMHPSGTAHYSQGVTTMTFGLSAADARMVGIAAHNPAAQHGVYIGYDQATQRWTFIHSPGGIATDLNTTIVSTQPVSGVTSMTAVADKPMQPALLTSRPGGFSDTATASGFGSMLCDTAAAADFDNDGDVDLYVVCRGANLNVTNRYFDNDGSGRFTEVPGAAGAGGPVGYGVGLGENVGMADYDVDGDVDLFVTNGLSLVPLGQGGPDLLFRNQANNTNHWLELDLVAVDSNRDATGARVILETPNGRQQLREQNGGYHRWSQHDRRLHFGLGPESSAKITVQWPSGRVETFTGVAADGIYRATEAGTIVQLHPVFESPDHRPTAQPQQVSTTQDTSLQIVLSGMDPEGAALSFHVNPPAHGSLAGAAPELVYSPEPGFSGTDSFTFTVDDGANTSAPATISITVTSSVPQPVAIRLRAGGPDYVDSLGQTWSSDANYTTTGVVIAPAPNSVQIANTAEDPLYRTGRRDDAGGPQLTYQIPVPNGSYTVRLHFAELDSANFSVGARQFDVQLENVTVASRLDVFAEAGGRTALIRSFPINVTDGAATITLVQRVKPSLIRALELTSN